MYLLSLYFDKKTSHDLKYHMNHIAQITNNDTMNDVLPHITLLAFDCLNIDKILCELDNIFRNRQQRTIQFVSFGVFPPYVIFVQPVLSKELHELSVRTYQCLEHIEGVQLSHYYQPFHWIPHATVAKRLNQEEMKKAFQYLHQNFSSLHGMITAIGLSKTNPYQDIKTWLLT